MLFDRSAGDWPLVEVDPHLADELWDAFLSAFVPYLQDEGLADIPHPQILIYVRPARAELQIDGPERNDEWWCPWNGDANKAWVFTEDVGHAAGLHALIRVRSAKEGNASAHE